MITTYIDDAILNHREITFDRNRHKGIMLLSEFEINSLSRYFTGIGVRAIDYAVIQFPGHHFELSVFDDEKLLFKLYNCTFDDPPTIITNDDSDLIPVTFSYKSDSNLFPGMGQINTGHIDQCGARCEALD